MNTFYLIRTANAFFKTSFNVVCHGEVQQYEGVWKNNLYLELFKHVCNGLSENSNDFCCKLYP